MPFYFRLNKVKILDNREKGFLFFIRDLAEVKLTSMIVSGNTDFPQIAEYKDAAGTKGVKDIKRCRNLASSMITQVVSQRQTMVIECVRDNQSITFGDTGYVVHQEKTVPDDLNWFFIAVEDDSAIRNFGASIESIVGSSKFDTFASSIATLVSTAANPGFAAGTAIVKFIAEVTAKALKKNKDDTIGLLYMSLNRWEHYPHGERKANAISDLSGNMFVDYSLFGFNQPAVETKTKAKVIRIPPLPVNMLD